MKYLKLFGEGRLLNDDEISEIRNLFQTFFDQEGWVEVESFGSKPDSGITYHIQNSHRYKFDSEVDKGKPIRMPKHWDGEDIHKHRDWGNKLKGHDVKKKYIHDSLVINVQFGKEYTLDEITEVYHEIEDYIEDLNNAGYTGFIWRNSISNLRIHISTKEADRFLKNKIPDE